ncbi:MAG: SDR family oxidoreductase, partial [Verrucomicrobiia bacterium]
DRYRSRMTLAGQNALVLGGGSGMGEAIALALAKEGVNVAIAGRRLEKLDAVAAQSTQNENEILTHTGDVGDRESVKALFEWFAGKFDRLHLLVNSAGVNVPKRSMGELSPEDWDKLMRINATGAFNCMHFGLPLMRPHKAGLIINISSIAGLRASHLGGVGYNASKFAMNALGTSASGDELENNIRITTICPGEVDTPILDDRPVPPNAEHRATILKATDVAEMVIAVAKLPARAHVPELTIKPTSQLFV